ncbi:MAG: STAS domain-containing protein [Streptosporangiales bacterium]|nr:STAS domain-containing protein [Streptosporangiales bacterium]
MSFAGPSGLYFGDGKGGRRLVAPDDVPALPADVPGPPPGSGVAVLVIGGPIGPADVPRLGEHIRTLLEGSDADLVVCDVASLTDPDAGTVDALARLALTARRLGRRFGLRHASRELQELLALVGLSDVLPLCGRDLRLGPRGQTEQREQSRRVEEGVDPDDPVT